MTKRRLIPPPTDIVEFMGAYLDPYFEEFHFFNARGGWYAAYYTDYLNLVVEFDVIDKFGKPVDNGSINCSVADDSHHYMTKFPYSEIVYKIPLADPDGPQSFQRFFRAFRRTISKSITRPPERGSGVPDGLKQFR